MNRNLPAGMGPQKNVILGITLILLAIGLPQILPAQEVADDVKPVESWKEGWDIGFVPYMWALSLDGDLTLVGRKVSVDVPFHDILDHLNAAVMGEVSVRKSGVDFFINPLYAQLEADGNSKTHSGNVKLDMLLMSFGVGYVLGPYDLGAWPCNLKPRLTIEPFAGGRYTYIKGDLDLKSRLLPRISGSKSKDWTDPIVGARTVLDLTERWNVILAGNLGGFNAGGSDFAWESYGLLGYRFKMFGLDANALAGYRALYMDYSEGGGKRKFEYDATLSGPLMGLSLTF